jgi:hypothetical protein
MTNLPDHFVTIADSYGKRLIEDGSRLYSFERGNEQFEVVMSASGGCDGRYRPGKGRDTYWHITVTYEIEAAVLPLLRDGWTLPEVDSELSELALQDQLAILRERKSGIRLTTPDLTNNDEFQQLKAEVGREKSRSGSLIVLMRSESGEEFAVYETTDSRYVGCVMDVDAESIEWYQIEPLVGIESATKCWLDTGYDLVEYDDAAAARVNEQIRKVSP